VSQILSQIPQTPFSFDGFFGYEGDLKVIQAMLLESGRNQLVKNSLKYRLFLVLEH
jgi:hypothetical protein